jgi:hypothetical protein
MIIAKSFAPNEGWMAGLWMVGKGAKLHRTSGLCEVQFPRKFRPREPEPREAEVRGRTELEKFSEMKLNLGEQVQRSEPHKPC